MGSMLREQLHQMIDRLDSSRLLAVRLFIEDLEAARGPAAGADGARNTPTRTSKRMTLEEYRKSVGLDPR